jgi:AcrR family transcriptional regulator
MAEKRASVKFVQRNKAKLAPVGNSTRMSGPGMARRQLLLNTARRMLRTTRLADLSLGEVARRAKVAKGSAYFFYEDVNALLASLAGVIDKELQEVLREPVSGRVTSWQDIFRLMFERGVAFLESDPAACQLTIGVDTTPALKLLDRTNDIALARIFDEQISWVFELPPIPDRPKLFFRAVELADVMLCLSMVEHGRISREYVEEATRAAIAYLQTYIPPKLPRRSSETDFLASSQKPTQS